MSFPGFQGFVQPPAPPIQTHLQDASLSGVPEIDVQNERSIIPGQALYLRPYLIRHGKYRILAAGLRSDSSNGAYCTAALYRAGPGRLPSATDTLQGIGPVGDPIWSWKQQFSAVANYTKTLEQPLILEPGVYFWAWSGDSGVVLLGPCSYANPIGCGLRWGASGFSNRADYLVYSGYSGGGAGAFPSLRPGLAFSQGGSATPPGTVGPCYFQYEAIGHG